MRDMNSFPWTDKHVETLKDLWHEGHPASYIAMRLGGGLSRNAVIGKITRLVAQGHVFDKRGTGYNHKGYLNRGKNREIALKEVDTVDLPLTAVPMPKQKLTAYNANISRKKLVVAAPIPAGEAFIPVRAVPYAPPEEAPEPVAVSLLDLTSRHCRWPVGEATGADQLYCGQAVDGTRYCSKHTAHGTTRNGESIRDRQTRLLALK